jgi:hypothetical protein
MMEVKGDTGKMNELMVWMDGWKEG